LPELWDTIERFYRELEPQGVISKRRQQQALDWLTALIEQELRRRFYEDPTVRSRLPELQQALLRGETTPARAAREILAHHRTSRTK
jgi:LAO/AO transport system kinase